MEKKIVLKMKTDGTIVIVINDEEKIEIAAAKRELKADELYSALNYSRETAILLRWLTMKVKI